MYVVLHRHPDGVDVRRERDLLDERAVLRLRLAQALLAVASLCHVAQRDGEEHRAGHVDAGDRDLGWERALVGAQRIDLESRAEQRAACRSRTRPRGRRGARARRRARGTACRCASARVQPNVSSVAGFTSTTRPAWSTITTQSSAARRTASLRPSLAASGALGALARGHVDHQRDRAEHVAMSVADRRRPRR